MKRIIYTLSFLISLSFNAVFAQKSCGTDEVNAELMQKFGNSSEGMKQFDAAFKEYLKTFDLSTAKVKYDRMGKNLKDSNLTTFIIPVVVHVFHTYGNENVKDNQIQSEIDFLNLSYKRLNADTTNTRPVFRDLAGVPRIEFRLARRDPQGNPTTGIVRVYSPLTDRGDDNLKTKSVWDSKRYFNIWLVQKIARDASAGIVAGYAQFPFSAGVGSSNTDGVMVNCLYFGSVGFVAPPDATFPTTTTHEAGHWLGLYHPFQGDSCDLENDGIFDTPPRDYDPASGNPNFCNVSEAAGNTCTNDNPDLPDMYENYMDYFGGSCAANMFTSQQVARMHFCIGNYRRELVSDSNIRVVGVANDQILLPNPTIPIASFDMYPNSGLHTVRTCVNKAISFQDNSYNGTVTSWAWDFGEGATPATSTAQNPSGVVYATTGWKTVKLTATNANGSNTLTREKYLYVEGPSDALVGSVHTADWDYLNDFMDKGWYFENETDNAKWLRVTNVQYDGNASLMLKSNTLVNKFNYSIISPSFDLTGAANPYITFNYAFAPNLTTLKISGSNATGDSQDGLSVLVSTDCGKTWLSRYKVSGNTSNPALINPMSTLPTSGGTSGIPSTITFTPSAKEQWKSVSVTGIGNITAASNVRFKISFNAQGGNNFYIDNLMVGMKTGINEITAEKLQFSSYPNPFNATTTLDYFNPTKTNLTVKLFDIMGKEIATVFSGNQELGRQKLTIDRSALGLSSGIYFVKLTFENSFSFSHKLIVE